MRLIGKIQLAVAAAALAVSGQAYAKDYVHGS